MIKIGITGGIASGKTLVSEYLESKGFTVICADRIYSEILETNDKMLDKIRKKFGKKVFDENNKLNRKKLAEIVFNNENKLLILNAVTHPFVKERINEEILKYRDLKIIFISIPLLYESRMENFCDVIIVVSCTKKLQIERLKKRNNMTANEAVKRIESQMPLKEKIKKADFVFKNNGTKQELIEQIDEFINRRISEIEFGDTTII